MSDWDPQVLPPAAVKAIREGRKIEAIKIVREYTGLGLAEAKAVVDEAARALPGGTPPAAQGREDRGGLRLLAVLVLLGALAAAWLVS